MIPPSRPGAPARRAAVSAAFLLFPILVLLTMVSMAALGGQAYAQGRPGWYRYEVLGRTVEIPTLRISMRASHTEGEPAARGRATDSDAEIEMVSLKGLASALGGAVRAGTKSGDYDLLLGTEVVQFSPTKPAAVRIRGSVIPLSRAAQPIGGDIYLPIDFMQRVITPILRAAAPRGGPIPVTAAVGAAQVQAQAQPSTPAVGFVVVLDPGHGGSETGAIGRTGAQEKEITLDVAMRLKALLEATPGVTVLLTRSEDGVVALDDRTALANQSHADMFLSIHVNSAPRRDARGAETYFLSYKSKDEDIRTLAAIENNAAGVDRERMGEVPESLDLVLWDLAQAHYLEESSRLAETIQMRLNEALGVRNRGVKQAPFRVLMGATMPAVLVEIGFISNPSEETNLKSGEYRDRIAQALARAVAAFLPGSKRRVVGSLGRGR